MSNDILVPTALSREMAHRIPDARPLIYEGAGHGNIFQYHDDFEARALAFLDEDFPCGTSANSINGDSTA